MEGCINNVINKYNTRINKKITFEVGDPAAKGGHVEKCAVRCLLLLTLSLELQHVQCPARSSAVDPAPPASEKPGLGSALPLYSDLPIVYAKYSKLYINIQIQFYIHIHVAIQESEFIILTCQIVLIRKYIIIVCDKQNSIFLKQISTCLTESQL